MYNDYSGYSDGGAAGLVLLFAALFTLPFLLIGYVLTSWFLMKLFDKAGVQGKWRAWVPLYNILIFVKLGDLSPWWLLILAVGGVVLSWVPVIGALIGIAAHVYMILAAYRIQSKLQKEGPWIILYIFLPIVWLGIMAFDGSRWNQSIPPAPWTSGFLADKTQWDGVPTQVAAGGHSGPAYGGQAPSAPGAYPPPAPGAYPPPAPGSSQPPVPPVPPTEPPAAPEPPRA